jgi:hypothetical protein
LLEEIMKYATVLSHMSMRYQDGFYSSVLLTRGH